MMRWLNFILLMASFISSFSTRGQRQKSDQTFCSFWPMMSGGRYWSATVAHRMRLQLISLLPVRCLSIATPCLSVTRLVSLLWPASIHVISTIRNGAAFRSMRAARSRTLRRMLVRNSRCGEVAVVLAQRRHGTTAKNGLWRVVIVWVAWRAAIPWADDLRKWSFANWHGRHVRPRSLCWLSGRSCSETTDGISCFSRITRWLLSWCYEWPRGTSYTRTARPIRQLRWDGRANGSTRWPTDSSSSCRGSTTAHSFFSLQITELLPNQSSPQR